MMKTLPLAAFVIACNRPAHVTPDASPVVVVTSSYAFHPIAKPDALGLCEELVEAKLASECVRADGGRDVALALLVGQPKENHVQILSFASPEGYSRLVKQRDVYRGSLRFSLGVILIGSVPDETKQRIAEAVDAL